MRFPAEHLVDRALDQVMARGRQGDEHRAAAGAGGGALDEACALGPRDPLRYRSCRHKRPGRDLAGGEPAALGAWSLSVSAELGPRGVTSNVIAAGYIEGTDFFRDTMSAGRRAALINATHDKRAGRGDDIAAAAVFLASAGARHLTGQTLHVNGGAYLTR